MLCSMECICMKKNQNNILSSILNLCLCTLASLHSPHPQQRTKHSDQNVISENNKDIRDEFGKYTGNFDKHAFLKKKQLKKKPNFFSELTFANQTLFEQMNLVFVFLISLIQLFLWPLFLFFSFSQVFNLREIILYSRWICLRYWKWLKDIFTKTI